MALRGLARMVRRLSRIGVGTAAMRAVAVAAATRSSISVAGSDSAARMAEVGTIFSRTGMSRVWSVGMAVAVAMKSLTSWTTVCS